MRVSQRLDYAVRALVLLATRPSGEYMAAGEIADRLGLPRRFVEQQITVLARAGIVRCRRGVSGGCTLARPAEQVSVRDIAEAIEGEVLDVPRHSDSATAQLWASAAAELEGFLEAQDVAGLATKQREIDSAASAMYFI